MASTNGRCSDMWLMMLIDQDIIDVIIQKIDCHAAMDTGTMPYSIRSRLHILGGELMSWKFINFFPRGGGQKLWYPKDLQFRMPTALATQLRKTIANARPIKNLNAFMIGPATLLGSNPRLMLNISVAMAASNSHPRTPPPNSMHRISKGMIPYMCRLKEVMK